MIKIVFSEVKSPTKTEDATDLDRSSGFRAINTSKSPSLISILDPISGLTKSITLAGGESLILKKALGDKVFSSTNMVLISGVSIY